MLTDVSRFSETFGAVQFGGFVKSLQAVVENRSLVSVLVLTRHPRTLRVVRCSLSCF